MNGQCLIIDNMCDYSCSICHDTITQPDNLEKYTSSELTIITTSCGHTYHGGCLRDWRNVATTCPMCRADTSNLLLPGKEPSDDEIYP